MVEIAGELPGVSSEAHKEMARMMLTHMQPRLVSFDEQACAIREDLAKRYEEEQQWALAAATLSEIDLDVRRLGDDIFRLKTCVQMAGFYMRANDLGKADEIMNRARLYRAAVSTDQLLIYQYAICWAELYDRMDRFMDASSLYLETSVVVLHAGVKRSLADELTSAIICATLAPWTPQKMRMIEILYKHEHCQNLEIYPILEKVQLKRILRADEVRAFQVFLNPHHTKPRDDGLSALQQAVIEHNLVSMSKVYSNIDFENLSDLLGVGSVQAEKITAKMIAEERLQGRIDQVERFVYFDGEDEPIVEWDRRIADVSLKLHNVVETMKSEGLIRQ